MGKEPPVWYTVITVTAGGILCTLAVVLNPSVRSVWPTLLAAFLITYAYLFAGILCQRFGASWRHLLTLLVHGRRQSRREKIHADALLLERRLESLERKADHILEMAEQNTR
jgi:hypothetical protein